MTPQEAIKHLEQHGYISDDVKDMCIETLNKQIARKYELFNGQCSCPNCKRLFGDYTQLKNLIHWEMSYCKHCGQALDWSDLE